jgi:hypothetical protein
MGIARRKAGTVVRCPACASQVTVPVPPNEGTGPATSSQPAPPLFERSDFDDLFNQAPVKSRQAPAPVVYESFVPPSPAEHFDKVQQQAVPPPGPARATMPAPLAPTGPVPGRPGIWLTPGLATLLSVAAVVALVLAFAAGLLIGSKLHWGSSEDQSRLQTLPAAVADARTE